MFNDIFLKEANNILFFLDQKGKYDYNRKQLFYEMIAQSVEHLPFKQRVPGSSPGHLILFF